MLRSAYNSQLFWQRKGKKQIFYRFKMWEISHLKLTENRRNIIKTNSVIIRLNLKIKLVRHPNNKTSNLKSLQTSKINSSNRENSKTQSRKCSNWLACWTRTTWLILDRASKRQPGCKLIRSLTPNENRWRKINEKLKKSYLKWKKHANLLTFSINMLSKW